MIELPYRYSLAVPEDEFAVERTLRSGQIFRWYSDGDSEWTVVDGNRIYRLARRGEELRIRSNAPESAFRLTFSLTPSYEARMARVLRRFRTRFGKDISLRGIRWVRPSNRVEVLFSFLCSSNNHRPRIRSLVHKLGAYGPELGRIDGLKLHAFPRLEVLGVLDEGELARLGFGYRSRWIGECAQRLLAERWPLTGRARSRADYEALRARLSGLPGVGPKVADCVLLYGFGCGWAFPIDVHVRRAVEELLDGTAAAVARRYDAIGDAMRRLFRADAGLAQLALYAERVVEERP